MLFSWKNPQIFDTASGNFSVGQFIGVDIDLGRVFIYRDQHLNFISSANLLPMMQRFFYIFRLFS